MSRDGLERTSEWSGGEGRWLGWIGRMEKRERWADNLDARR